MKTGRKPKHFITSDDKRIEGLTRDERTGRWRIIGTMKTFREPDEKRAIQRFYDFVDPDIEGVVAGLHVKAKRAELVSVRDQIAAMIAQNEREYYAAFADDLRSRPKYVAEMTGIEELGYLKKLNPPEPLPGLDELKQTFKTHSPGASKHRHLVARDWDYFVEQTKIKTLEDVTRSVVIAFRDMVHGRNLSAKRQQHIFTGVRHLLRFNLERSGRKEIEEILGILALLKPQGKATKLNPKPIQREDFDKLLVKAEGQDKAMLLLCLNSALYLQEAVDQKWEYLDDENALVSRRKKKGEMWRMSKLWPETIEALKGFERRGEHIFYSQQGERLTASGAGKRWRKLRDDAGVPHVEANQLRDGASTAMKKARIDSDIRALVRGHQSGIEDCYALPDVSMVEPAMDAIYSKYLGNIITAK